MKFYVEGLRCGYCVLAITRSVEAVRARARVDLRGGVVDVSDNIDPERARRAIQAVGYAAVAIVEDEPPNAALGPLERVAAAPLRSAGAA